eukprot:1572396-Karenia_brevis.AAC.1
MNVYNQLPTLDVQPLFQKAEARARGHCQFQQPPTALPTTSSRCDVVWRMHLVKWWESIYQ